MEVKGVPFKDIKSPQFFYEKGNHIKKIMDDFYLFSASDNEGFWTEASLDSRFEAGDQSAFDEIHGEIPAAFRKQFNFNRIRRITNMISGFQRRNRKSLTVTPVENGDQETADQYSKIFSHINRKEHLDETISDGFSAALITGMPLLNIWMDYRKDPVSGSLKIDLNAYNTFLIDPYFKKHDLSDCNQIWKRTYLTPEQVISLLPDRKKEILELSSYYSDGKFGFMPENSSSNKRELMAYDEYYYMDSRKQMLLADSTTGEVFEWQNEKGVKEDELTQFLQLYPAITVIDSDTPSVKLAILVNGTLMYDGPNPLGIDRYPFVPIFAYFNPSLQQYSMKVQSVVRGLRDAQFLYNRRKAIEDDIVSSQLNSGFIYKEDALVDKNDVFKTGQGKGIALQSTALMTDIIPIPAAQLPPSMFQLSEFYAREIMEISGANEELLGSAVDDKAGVLAMLRQGAGLTTLQPLFDNLDRACKSLGSIMLEVIQKNFTSGKVKRIIEEEPTQQFYNKAFGTYDAAIAEGFNTTTQKATEFAQLLHLKEVGIAVPDEVIIEAATLQNKTKLIEAIQQQQQAAQQQQQQMADMQQRLQEAQTNLANAKVESDLSLAKERDSRVYANIGLMEERKNESEKDKTQSLLNLVKTMKEMDTIDIDQLVKYIQLSKIVQPEDQKVENIGAAINQGATKDVPNVPTQKSIMQNMPVSSDNNSEQTSLEQSRLEQTSLERNL